MASSKQAKASQPQNMETLYRAMADKLAQVQVVFHKALKHFEIIIDIVEVEWEVVVMERIALVVLLVVKNLPRAIFKLAFCGSVIPGQPGIDDDL